MFEIVIAVATGVLPIIIVLLTTLIPVFITLELLERFGVAKKVESHLAPFMNSLTLPKEAALPYTLGLFFGISVAVGTLMHGERMAHDKKMRQRLITLLAPCHGLLEETAFIVVLGGMTSITVLTRIGWLIVSVIVLRVTALLGRRLSAKSDAVREA